MSEAPDRAGGPFFCFQGRDGSAFRTREDAEFSLDPGEVKKGRWRFFAADGTEFRLTTRGSWGDQRVVATDEVVGHFPGELRELVVYGLGLIPKKDRRLSEAAIANASLEELGEELTRYYADWARGMG